MDSPTKLSPEFFTRHNASKKKRAYTHVKRALDILLSIQLFILLLPVFAVIALMIKLDSPGNILFWQYRYGEGGKPFRLWKFRSMYTRCCNETGGYQVEKDDPRVTRIGKMLRRSSFDEWPQLFNVLCGDMSLVGPRPHAVEHDLHYSQHIPNYTQRLSTKPGLTGLAQIKGFRGETWTLEQMHYRVLYDLDYIQKQSLGLDMLILMLTWKILLHPRAY